MRIRDLTAEHVGKRLTFLIYEDDEVVHKIFLNFPIVRIEHERDRTTITFDYRVPLFGPGFVVTDVMTQTYSGDQEVEIA